MENKKERIIKSVSFKEDEYILLKFAEDNGNFSYFVKELIKEKMNNYTLQQKSKEDEIKIMLTEIKDKLNNTSITKINDNLKNDNNISMLDAELLDEIDKFD